VYAVHVLNYNICDCAGNRRNKDLPLKPVIRHNRAMVRSVAMEIQVSRPDHMTTVFNGSKKSQMN